MVGAQKRVVSWTGRLSRTDSGIRRRRRRRRRETLAVKVELIVGAGKGVVGRGGTISRSRKVGHFYRLLDERKWAISRRTTSMAVYDSTLRETSVDGCLDEA